MKLKKLFVSIVCMCSCCAVFGQNVKLSTLFSDGCVLQQKSKVPVWGTADPGEAVVVSGSWNDEQVKVTADETGKWIAYLSTPAGGASSYTLNVNDEKVENVLVGILPGQQTDQSGRQLGWLELGRAKAVGEPQIRFPLLQVFNQGLIAALLVGAHHHAAAHAAEQQNIVEVWKLVYTFAACDSAYDLICLPAGLITIYIRLELGLFFVIFGLEQ